MKTRKTRLTAVIGIAVFGLTLLLNGSAWAGAKVKGDVSISSSSSSTGASGTMTGARFGKGKEQYIGCSLQHVTSSNSFHVYCSARDENNKVASCYSNDNWGHREIVQSMTVDSNIFFSADQSGVCTYLSTRTHSMYMK